MSRQRQLLKADLRVRSLNTYYLVRPASPLIDLFYSFSSFYSHFFLLLAGSKI